MPLPPLNSSEAYAINMDSDEVYFTFNHQNISNKASTIKGLTVHTMRVYCYATKAEMVAATEDVIAADIVGGTGVPLVVGDTWDMWALAMNAMFPSSNDACQTLARHCGDKIYNDAGQTGTQGVERFVEEMNVLAAAYGMTNTTITRPDGISGNLTTVEDLGKFLANSVDMFDDEDFRTTYIQSSTTETFNSGASSRLFTKDGVEGTVCPGYIMSKAGTPGHLWSVNMLPNGQLVGIVTTGAAGVAASDDHLAIYRAVLEDFPAAATPSQPADLAWMAAQSGGNLVAWDESGLMYQDDGTSVPAVNDGDKVRRWYPSVELGVSGNYLRCDSDAARPDRDTSVPRRIIDFSGGAWILHIGAKGIGNTEHFADAGDAWMTAMYTQGSGTSGTVFGRRGSGAIDIQMFYNSATAIAKFLRGTNSGGLLTPPQNTVGGEGVHGTGWNGTEHRWLSGQIAEASTDVGGASNSTNNFAIGNHFAGYPWEAGFGRIVMIDTFDLVVFEKMRDWCMGTVTNQVRDPAGPQPVKQTYDMVV